MEHGRTAIVVIGRNEGDRLARCLSSLPRHFPVIYADSASTDESVTIASDAGAEVVSLPPDTTSTAARGRNAGAFRALELYPDCEFLQFIDGDCTLIEGWMPAAIEFLEANPNVAVACGRRFERHPEHSIYNALCDREWQTPVGRADSSGGDAMVRTQAFVAVGGFSDDQIAHEEPEMCGRLRDAGWDIWRIDKSMTAHDAAMSRLGQFYRRSRRAGIGISQCLDRGGLRRDPQGTTIIIRSLAWGLALPLAFLIFLFVDVRLSGLLLTLYIAQILRQCLRNYRQGWPGLQAFHVASLSLISKFAEAHGAMDYWAARLLGRRQRPIIYK